EVARDARVPRRRRGRRAAALRALLPRPRRRDDRRIRARRSRHLRRGDVRRRDGRRDARPRPATAAALPAPRAADRDRRSRRLDRRRPRPLSRIPRALRPALRPRLLGGVRVRRHRVSRAGHNSRLMARIPLPALAAAAFGLVTTALALVFFVAPTDADQGFSQRIFYFHVSIAFTAYACFIGGAWKALVHLWKRDPRADLESYVAVHQGVIFGALVLLTGSIWAKISWGHWWLWSENQLVLFLVLFLFYCAYFMLRCTVRTSAAGSSPRTASRRWRCSCSRTPCIASSSPASGSTAGCATCGGHTHDDRRDLCHRRILRRLRARAAVRRDHRAEAAAARARGGRARAPARAGARGRAGAGARWLSFSSGRRSCCTARPRSATSATRGGPAPRDALPPGACGSAGSCRRRSSSCRPCARTASPGRRGPARSTCSSGSSSART